MEITISTLKFQGLSFLGEVKSPTRADLGPSPHLKSSRITGLDSLKAFKSMSMLRKCDTICALISTGLASCWRLRWWRAFDIRLLSSACRSSTWWRQDHPWVIRSSVPIQCYPWGMDNLRGW
jgi:hypothetical protein